MADSIFNTRDIQEIEERGMTSDEVLSQIESFKRGFPKSRLARPCTIGDGITVLGDPDLKRLGEVYSEAALSGRAMKFVPASGAASRMFKSLLSVNNRGDEIDEKQMAAEAEKGDSDSRALLQFIRAIERFAFYDDLRSALSREGLGVENPISQGQYKKILEYLLTSRGLNLANLPKGLIKFHHYPEGPRTPFEEQLVEGAAYVRDGKGVIRIHFTVTPEHEMSVKDRIKRNLHRYERSGIRYDLTFSIQKASTDTIAVDLENRPFREKDRELVFRPGGHGALLANLIALGGDIVFIKNIDNVVSDRLKQVTTIYKKALGGFLVEVQEKIFNYLRRLLDGDMDGLFLNRVFEFVSERLCITPPEGMVGASGDEKREFLLSILNRPLRVCGMVKNEGEPGGGPFWVEHRDKTLSIQIVESSQVDMQSVEQRRVWESSTHFNPVDLVCGVRDHAGVPFDLVRYRDPDTGFISIKSKSGRELKALEHPGLWNGSMAKWNTAFVEVPIITFNPVKTLFDLLREEHQPE
ncbi:MAG: DUF4301 family protein [Pseudomonadota bacterium]